MLTPNRLESREILIFVYIPNNKNFNKFQNKYKKNSVIFRRKKTYILHCLTSFFSVVKKVSQNC